MKRILPLFFFILFFITGCSQKNESLEKLDKDNKSSVPLFYKSKEYFCSDFDILEDVMANDNYLYEFGWKTYDENKEICKIYSIQNNIEQDIRIAEQYDEIIHAYKKQDIICILYLFNNEFFLTSIDAITGKTVDKIKLDYFPQTVLCTDNYVLVLSDDINTRDVIIYKYDLTLKLVSTINFCQKTTQNGFSGNCIKMDYHENNLFFFGKNSNGELYLFCMDEDMNIQYIKCMYDMPGRASDIFFEGSNLVLCSYDDSCLYVDNMDITDGAVKDRYEIPNVSKVFGGYSNDTKLCRTSTEYYYYNTKEQQKDYTEIPKCLSEGNYCYFSDDSYIIFPNIYSEIHTVCKKYNSNHDVQSEIDLGTSVIKYGLFNDTVYSLSYLNETTLELKIFKEEKSIDTINLLVDYDKTCTSFCIADDIMLLSLIDSENCCQILKYDMNGCYLGCIFSESNTYVNKIFKNQDSIYISCIINQNDIKIMKIYDGKVCSLSEFDDMVLSNVFKGDNQYDFFYEFGSAIYGYDAKIKNSSKIIDLIENGLIYSIDSFSKISDNCYFCQQSSDLNIICLQLQKLSNQEQTQLNNRKKIIIAGKNIKDNITVSEKILEFNKENLDYYITVKDYSSDGTILDDVEKDIVDLELPDLYIFDKSFDLSALCRTNALYDITELIDNDSELDINDFFSSVLYTKLNDKKIYGITTSFRLSEIVFNPHSTDENITEAYDYDSFIKLLNKNDIRFKYATEESLRDQLIISKASEFIDFEKKECYFNSTDFVSLLKYISNSISSDGTAGLHVLEDFLSLGYLSALYDNNYIITDVSINGTSKSTIDISNSFGFAVSSVSDNKDGSWLFIKEFLTEEYQNQVQGFPILKKSFDNKFSEEIKYNGHTASIYTPDLDEPINYVINISEYDKEIILNLIESSFNLGFVDLRIKSIIQQELYRYTNDLQTAEETASIIQNKITIYLNET